MPHANLTYKRGRSPGRPADVVDHEDYNAVVDALQNTPTLEDLQSPVTFKGVRDHTGNLPDSGNTPGDAYLVNGVVWVWSGSAWTNQGSLTSGPQGEPAALRLMGTVPTTDDLPASANLVNDVWVVDADSHGYGWTADHVWVDLGEMRGPQGPGGEDTVLRARVDPGTSLARAEVVTGDGSGNPIKIRIRKTPDMYGAVGDYNPDTNTGTDDTAAIQAWINDLAPGEEGEFPPFKLYKCTAGVIVKRWTEIVGAGRTSGLFFILSDPATMNGITLQRTTYGATHNDHVYCGKLRNFGVYCRGPLNTQASVGGQAGVAGIYLQRATIDLFFAGHWRSLMKVASTTGVYGDISGGGGIEDSTIRLEHDWQVPMAGYAYIPWKAYRGMENRGWSNGVKYTLSLRLLEGSALRIEGMYANAGAQSTVEGVLQGISQTALEDTIRWENGSGPTIKDLYQEANGGGLRAINWAKGVIDNCRNPIRLTACEGTYIARSTGITLDSDCIKPIIGPGNTTVTNQCPSTIYEAVPRTDVAIQTTVQTGVTRYPSNFILNGGFDRWVAGSTPPMLWNVQPTLIYTAEKCGDGLTDTTRTANTPYCIKLADREGFSERLAMPLIPAGSLAGLLGSTIYLSFKYKIVSGRLAIQAADGAGVITASYLTTVQTQGIPCENGFTRYVHAFTLLQPMIDSGLVLWFHVPDYLGNESVVYLSEVMAGLGAGAPAIYEPPSYILGHPGARMEGGNLVIKGTAAPASGGDPICGRPWQVGDRIEFTNPTASGYMGAVCTTAGSLAVPLGTWKTYGPISA